ncbi:Transcriptional regulator, MarR family [Sulfitobacter noctilucicola]|uniref:DNA-binding MarR family transcriptional regulator n=1 Tax=Sulfitobacter noctilucicola TaxID=1342301 RepID=A0A7W6MBH7_9RHOB|nr:MarR family transcriptional regulator [Sulfitobacter noctilucicola]KIN70012.1 Transcriptional regulator, MarR family [Sulfitobacter noctilucicola]MBB4176025.1 DNA-binding MarR family transcriptional regulator [Sulfitobacter noctilucicola]
MNHETPLSRRRLRTWLRLLRVTRATENRLREYLRLTHETTLPRFDVMAALYNSEEPMMMSELSKRLLVSNGNASTVVNRLEKDGLVERQAQEKDRRVVKVSLTDAGRATFQAQAVGHEKMVNDIFETLGHEEIDMIRDLLRRAEDRKAQSK